MLLSDKVLPKIQETSVSTKEAEASRIIAGLEARSSIITFCLHAP